MNTACNPLPLHLPPAQIDAQLLATLQELIEFFEDLCGTSGCPEVVEKDKRRSACNVFAVTGTYVTFSWPASPLSCGQNTEQASVGVVPRRVTSGTAKVRKVIYGRLIFKYRQCSHIGFLPG